MSLPIRIILKFIGLLAGLAITAGLGLGVFALSLLPDLPTVESIKDVPLKVPLRVYSAEGSLLAEFGEERREPVTIDQVPKPLIDAVLASEDDSFYTHPGVDLKGVVRAALANLRSGEHEQGASTITMQVARNYFLTPEKTYTRKLKEALLAFRLERALSKDQILELYLNKIFLGHRAYGFAAASRVYYGHGLEQLALPQMAMLAGLPKAPSRDNPLSSPERAQKRRNYVLRRMLELGKLDQQSYEAAVRAPLTASRHVTPVELQAPYVAEMVRAHMLDKYGEEAYWRGFKVYTTIRAEYQRTADRALRTGLINYDRRHGYRGPAARHKLTDAASVEELDRVLQEIPSVAQLKPALVIAVAKQSATVYTRDHGVLELDWNALRWARPYQSAERRGPAPDNARDVVHPGDVIYVLNTDSGWQMAQVPAIAGALVSLRPDDGAILALTGGFDFYQSKFNRVMQAERQPGSNIKPFIYSAALEHGFTPATLVSGGPIVVADKTQETVWRPENYSGKFFGPTRLRKALSLSLNLVSVRVLRAIGTDAARSHLSQFGFDREKLPSGLSLALGSMTVTPIEMVRAYAVFANGGYQIQPYVISWVEDADGGVIEQARPSIVCRQCLRADAASVVQDGQSSGPAAGFKPAKRVLKTETHFLITNMMKDVIRAGTGRKALQLGRHDLAGKTGTTNDFRDAWFSGFNREVVTTVWTGFDDSATLGRGEAGSKVALPIWIDYMKVALSGRPERDFKRPDNIVTVAVHRDSGRAVRGDDPAGYEEYFKIGTQPRAAAGDMSLPSELEGADPGGTGTVREGLF